MVDKNILLLEQNGIESISDFAGMDGSEEDLRATLINQFDLAKSMCRVCCRHSQTRKNESRHVQR